MFPIGLAAVDQGYYGAAPAYWKARELEDTNAAYNLLGQTFMQMSGQGQQPTGWGGQPAPGMIPGGQPMPPGGMPPGGAPGAPPGMMRPGMMPPTTPQGTLGSIIPSPAAGPAAIPQAGGMPPAQAPAPTAPPGPLTGAGPSMPPPSMGGAGGFQQPPPAVTQALGPAPYDWRQVAQTIAQANPGASPAVIARAVTMMMPFMQQDSQNQWRQIQLYMQEQRLDETRRAHEAGEAGRAAGREETERSHREAERQREERLRQSDTRMQNTEAWRAQEAARKDAMAASTLDKQDFDRKMQLWKQKYTIFDRNERARINAATNLTGKEKKDELARLDEQRGAAERDMEEFASQLPEKRQVPQRGSPAVTPQQRVNEGFGGAGQGKTQPVSPQQQADFRKLIESGQFTQDQVIQYLQQNNLDASWLMQ